ncbi:MAG: SMP-30/gluconolactonase/LRE family protein, partial [Gammaproteobacteria bacterium]|nr:SMP-30/gluconolactonase/LRE family protein [Gammaproteobacteria bacterium]
GLPDNLQGDGQGRFWVALPSPRKADVDLLHRLPALKNLLARLPRTLWPGPVPYGLVIVLDEQGQIQASLHDPSGAHLRMITSVKPANGYLYLGSLDNDRIGRLPLPQR